MQYLRMEEVIKCDKIADSPSAAAGGLTGGKAGAQISVMGFDALGGYVFARMAHNMGESLITVLFLIPLSLTHFTIFKRPRHLPI